jgi:hypothetical protein
MTVPGYTGWGQRSPDFGHSSLGGPPGPEHGRRRRSTPLLAGIAFLGLLGAIAFFVVRADGADDEQVAAELEERSQPPEVQEVRLVEDRLELHVDERDHHRRYCIQSPDLEPEGLEGSLCGQAGGPRAPSILLSNLGKDADELVGLDVTVTAVSPLLADEEDLESADLLSGPAMLTSDPSDPVQIVDAR